MDSANWALRTSLKFTTGVNIGSNRVFDQVRDPEIPINLRPHIYIYYRERGNALKLVHLQRKGYFGDPKKLPM